MTRATFLAQIHARFRVILSERRRAGSSVPPMEEPMTMADAGFISMELSRFWNEHRLPYPEEDGTVEDEPEPGERS